MRRRKEEVEMEREKKKKGINIDEVRTRCTRYLSFAEEMARTDRDKQYEEHDRIVERRYIFVITKPNIYIYLANFYYPYSKTDPAVLTNNS